MVPSRFGASAPVFFDLSFIIKMKYKRYPLLEHQFDSLPFEEWKIKELPFSLHNHIPNTFRAKDAVGILYSGDMGSPKFIEGFENIVAGFDIPQA